MKTFKQITPEQITKWKQTKGKLKEVTIPIDGEDTSAKFIICKPTRNVLSALADASERKDSDKAQELLIENCVLGGDMAFIDEDDDKHSDVSIYLALLEEVGKFMQTQKVKSKFI